MVVMIAAAFGGDPGIASVNVQMPPVLLSTIKIADPVAVKWTATSNLYVLSGNTATLTEFDVHEKPVRSKTGIGSNPSGLAVDAAGNVYVAVTGSNQVWKFKPTADSFVVDSSFGNGGFIGNKGGSAGAGSDQLNAPFDVAISRNGHALMVSDSGNYRIQRFTPGGTLTDSFGGKNDFGHPKGLAIDAVDLVFVADSDNNRVAVWSDAVMVECLGTSGTNGTAPGQFQGPLNLSVSERGLYVADTGNNRIQVFVPPRRGEMRSATPFFPRISVSGGLDLNHPKAVAAVDDLLEEKFYIADTGNNRVLLVKLPSDNPEATWRDMNARLKAGDVDGALSYFSIAARDQYRETFLALTKDDLRASAKSTGNIKPVYIYSDRAQYYFDDVIDGQKITFPIEFDREFGQWKIMEY